MLNQKLLRMVEGDGGTPPPATPPVTPPAQPIEANKVLAYMGLEDVKSFDEFQEKFAQEFVRTNPEIIKGHPVHSKIIGNKIGGIKTAMQRALRTNNVQFSDDDFKEEKIETLVESWLGKTATLNADKVKELEAKLATGVDERVTKLQAEYDAAQAKLTEATAKLTTVETEWSEKLTKKEQEILDRDRRNAKDKTYSGIKYANGVDDLKKKGFIATVEESVKFDFDENGKFVPLKDGKKIPNPAKADTFFDADEYIKAEAIKAGVWALAPNGGTPPKSKTINTEIKNDEPKKPHQMINPIRPRVRTGV